MSIGTFALLAKRAKDSREEENGDFFLLRLR